MNFIQKNMAGFVFALLILMLPALSFAQLEVDPCDAGKVCNPISKVQTVNGLIKVVLEGVIKIALPFLAIAIIYTGFLFVSARGNSEAIKKAKESLLYTLIGAAIILGSWAIAQLITETVSALK